MQCLQSYSTVQNRNTVGPRSSGQIIAVTPLPWVHPHNEMQNMVATQYPKELGVAYSPARLHISFAQSQNNLQVLLHQQEALARTVSTGSQPPTLANTKTAINPSAHVTGEHSGYYGTMIHGCSGRQSVNESEQQREYFSRESFLNGSNLNEKTGLQEINHNSNVLSASGNSAALREDKLEVAKTPLKVQGSSLTAQERCPLLSDLLTGNLLESKTFSTSGSSPEETNANMALNIVIHVAERGLHESSTTALDRGQTRTRALHHLEGSPSVQVSFPSCRLQTSNDTRLPVGETNPPTKKDIHAAITKKLAYFYDYLMQKKQNKNSSKFGEDSTLPSTPSHLHKSAAFKEDVARHNGVSIEEPCAASTAALEKHSTECPHPMLKVVVTCTKNEAECPGVLTAMLGTTGEDQRKKRPGSKLNCNLSQEKSRLSWLNVNTISDDLFNHCTERENRYAAHNAVETVRLDNTQDIADQTKSSSESGHVTLEVSSLSEYQNAKKKISNENSQHHRVLCNEGTAISNYSVLKTAIPNMLSIPTNQSEPQSSPTRHAKEEAASACSQAISVPVKELQKHAPLGEGMVDRAYAVYEDISDDDMSHMTADLPNTDHWELGSHASHASCFEDTIEVESKAVETTTPVLDNEDEMDDYHLVIPISIFKLKFEPEDENPDSSGTTVPEVVETGKPRGPSTTRCPSPTAFPSVPVFDTPECFLQAVQCEVALGSGPLVHETDSEGAVSTPPKRKASVDSCDTEDSCDYSSASEHNFLTVPRKMMRKGSATDDSLSEEEGKDTKVTNIQKDQMRSVNNLRKRLKTRLPSEAKKGCCKQILTAEGEDIIVLDSDTEDESVQICEIFGKSKQGCTSSLDDIADSSCSQQKRHSLGTESQKNTYPSACSPTAPGQSRDDPVFEEEMQDVCSDASQGTEKGQQFIQTKDVAVQHKTHIQKSSPVKGVIIIIDSDAEDDDPQNCVKLSREISAVSGNGNARSVEPETAYRGCGPAEAKLQESGHSLADSLQRQSNFHNTPFRGATEGACSYQSHSEQMVVAKGVSEHVPRQEHKGRGVGHHASKEVVKGNFTKKAIPEGMISSGSEGNCDVTQNRQGVPAGSLCGTDNSYPVIARLLAQPSQNKACLKLFREPNKQRRDEYLAVQTPTSSKNKKVGFLLPQELADDKQTENNVLANAQKPALVPRRLSLPLQEGPSTACNSLSFPGEHCHIAKPRSAYSRSLKLKAFSLPFNPREHSFPPKLRRSCSSSATSEPTKGPAPTVQLNATGCAKQQLNDCSPIRRRRICSQVTKDIRRPALHDKAGREKAPRKKRQPPKAPTSMMKKATNDAIQWTKNRKRVSQKESDSVGEGYKWAEKSNVAKPAKGPCREKKGR